MVSSPEAARQTQGPLLGALALGGFGGFQLLIEVLEVLGVVQRGFFMLCLLRAPSRLLLLGHDRASSLDYYEIKSNSSLERYDSIGPPFHCTFKVKQGDVPGWDVVTLPIPCPPSLSFVLAAAEPGLLPRGWGDHQAHRPRGHQGGQPPPAPDRIRGGPGRKGGFRPPKIQVGPSAAGVEVGRGVPHSL